MTRCSDRQPIPAAPRRIGPPGMTVADQFTLVVGYGLPSQGRQVAEIDETAVLATVGAHILERRTELGFSQRELAAAAGVDRAFLARVEQGLRNPSVVLLAKVAQAMKTNVSALTRGI